MDKSELPELLPCPFCGSHDARSGCGTVMPHKNRAPKLGHNRYHYAIRCGSCGFNGPRGLTEQQAKEGWNARADSSLIESVKALYFAGYWHCDRPVDEEALWTAVRSAAGISPGQTADRLGADQSKKAAVHS